MLVRFSIISTEGFRLQRKKSCHIKELSPNLFNAPCCEYKSDVPLGSSKYSSSVIFYLRSSTTHYQCHKMSLVCCFADLNSCDYAKVHRNFQVYATIKAGVELRKTSLKLPEREERNRCRRCLLF